MSTETMSTRIATPPTAALVPPVRRTVPPSLLRAGRSRAVQTLVLATLGLVSGVLLVQQIGSVDLLGTLADASPVWLAVAVGASIVPFLGAALSLMAFAPGRLPLRRTTAVQVASSYASVVLPPSVGQVAVNAQFLQRLGHGGATVAATVALTQVSGLVVTLVLLAVALAATSTTISLTGATVTVAVILLGAAAALLLVPRVRRAVAATAATALPAVLVYGAVTLWMRVAPGWVAMTTLRRHGVL